nr:zinc finger, CCHC-type [Tanacetum cinerariifolium]
DEEKNGHLKKLENAEERLRLLKADLLDYEGLCDAFSGCNGVLHVASPVPGRHVSNPQLELLDPAILGTQNVLNACLKAKVEKVVVVSSGSAVLCNHEWPSDKEMDESCWTDIEYAKSLDVTQEGRSGGVTMENTERAYVDVRDLSEAILLLFENPKSEGRYICSAYSFRTKEFVQKMETMFPGYNYPKIFSEKSGRALLNSKKLLSLGWYYRPVDETIVDTVKNYEDAGFLDKGKPFPSTISVNNEENVGDVNNGEFVVDGDERDKELDVMGMMGESMNKAMENVSEVISESDVSDVNVKDGKSSDQQMHKKLNEKVNLAKSYASTVNDNIADNKLKMIPTVVNEGREVVIFDDEIILVGIKWRNTLCGHFVGYRMSYTEIKYNLGRMRGKYGLVSRDAIFDENRFSSINKPKVVVQILEESQRDDNIPSEDPEPRKEYPRTYNEAMQSHDIAFWKEAIHDEISSIMGNDMWALSDLPPGYKPLGIDKFKARLVIQGFGRKEGIDYFDTHALIVCITTIRLLLALAAFHNLVIHQMDVKTTFLNGDLMKYMKQPEGFVMLGNEHKVCKLVKSLYGLKQVPKQWHQKFDEVVLSSGFLLNQSDKYVYRKFDRSGKGVIVCLYVDDMLIFMTDQNQVDKTKKFLSSRFSMKDMGEADVILGIKIKQKLKPNTGKPVDQLEYSRAIGCLMYAMTSTRPDIVYVVGRLSRFTSNPSRQHWKAITRVFKYLRGTKDYGLSYVGYPSVQDKMSRDVIMVGSTMRIPVLYRGEYSRWRERFLNYLEEQTDIEAMINSIQNGDQPLHVIASVSLAGTTQNASLTLKDLKFWTAEEKKTRKIDRLARGKLRALIAF